jgi:hypothetical protein
MITTQKSVTPVSKDSLVAEISGIQSGNPVLKNIL